MSNIVKQVSDGLGLLSYRSILPDNEEVIDNIDVDLNLAYNKRQEVIDNIDVDLNESSDFNNNQILEQNIILNDVKEVDIKLKNEKVYNEKIEIIDSHVISIKAVVEKTQQEDVYLNSEILKGCNIIILKPDRDTFIEGEEIYFEVEAKEFNENVNEGKIKWYSNRDGIFLYGNKKYYNLLSIGKHFIKVIIEDRYESSEIEIIVKENNSISRVELT